MLSSRLRGFTVLWTVLVLIFVYAPLLLVVINAFNASNTFAFPPTGFTLQWWRAAWNSEGMWASLGNSVVVGLAATAIALVLGTMVALRCSGTTSSVNRPSICLWCCRSRYPAS